MMKSKKLYEANRYWNDWTFQLYWNKIEWVNPRSQIKIENLFIFFKDIFFIDKDIRTSHWVGHSKIKELYINDFFDSKQM